MNSSRRVVNHYLFNIRLKTLQMAAETRGELGALRMQARSERQVDIMRNIAKGNRIVKPGAN